VGTPDAAGTAKGLAHEGAYDQPYHGTRASQKKGLSLQANRKRFTGPPHPDRERQFHYLHEQKEAFLKAGDPVISVDTKKKELIGPFKNNGRRWRADPVEVNAHDFRQDAECIAAPYGIYDVGRNHGLVYVGTSADTAEFATDAMQHWWRTQGEKHYPKSRRLLILADAGGSNNCRSRLFKQEIQAKLANAFGLRVTVCHYPTGASKWNPVEHRLFGPISCQWAGVPLKTLDILLECLRDTHTETGLRVCAKINGKSYAKGIKVSNAQMRTIRLQRHEVCPDWNYTIKPNTS
jgi:hypothetical protein